MADLLWTLRQLDVRAVVDILLVALIFWGLLRLIQGTQAVQLLRGVILVVLFAALLTSIFRLTAFSWLMAKAVPALLLAIPVVFQPELRRALERLGRAGAFPNLQPSEPVIKKVIDAVVIASGLLAERRHGALIVLERDTGLEEYVDTGVRLDASLSPELLLTLFYPSTALHDGAAIVRDDNVVAAGCVLPLSTGTSMDYLLGTRHRAGIGLTEQTDAVVVIVSEETGIISVAYNGKIIRRLDENRLTKILEALFQAQAAESTWAKDVGRSVRSLLRRAKRRAAHTVRRIPGLGKRAS